MLMQVFTSVLVLGLCFAFFVITHIRDYKQRKADSMIGLAQVIGSNSVSAIQFQDNDAAKEILQNYPTVAILMITAYDSIKSVFNSENMFKDKKIALVVKPIKLFLLNKLIKDLVNG